MKKFERVPFVVLIIFMCFLTACVTAPSRSNRSAFELVQEGYVSDKNTLAFSDCLIDGFDKTSFVFTTASVRQQRRAEGYRVEVITNSAILVSADIHDSGKVELFESEVTALISTEKERSVFAECLKRYKVGN